jgi:hypothetical protein
MKDAGERAVQFFPIVRRSGFYALVCGIPVLAVMAIVLNAILPAPDPSTGLRAGAWFGPLVLAAALAILLGLMLGYLYVHLVCKESVPALVRRQVRKAMRPIAAAIDRTDIAGLLDPIRARAVVIALAALFVLLGLALLWIGFAVVKALPWWAALTIVIAFIGIVRKRKGPGAQ